MGKRYVGKLALVAVVALIAAGLTGCGHIRNVRDDLMDCGSLAVGVVPPVVPGAETTVVGPLPPALGIYAEATEFLHAGAIYKATGDLEWDRRGLSATVDIRRKVGIGPFHDVYIKQEAKLANAYKTPGELAGWRRHMKELSDPLFDAPAKTMIFRPEERSFPLGYDDEEFSWQALPWMSRGWQDWEMFSIEAAVPEPFILHSGFYARMGFDPSQVVDLALTIFGVDLYDDAAYDWEGNLQH